MISQFIATKNNIPKDLLANTYGKVGIVQYD